ncbi:flavoprotein-like protein [Scheffersomyces xylosifermentans]|uniref:flavoprotein-like protein n=1 Tax=Scheffersomyces xylosifermentans TaxID=1304137 RepID=UPI00315CFD77
MKVAVIQYSTYGHITVLARSVKEGVESTGLASKVDLFQIPETLSPQVLDLLHAPPKPTDIPVASPATLAEYDALLLGIPTRFGTLPGQWIDFWGKTSGLWAEGALAGKPVGIFVSTGTPGGGQEITIRNAISYLAHHGTPFVPLGYGKAFPDLTSFDEIHGGSPWGAGTFAGSDGSRQPSALELRVAKVQGETFATTAIKFFKSKQAASKFTLDPKNASTATSTTALPSENTSTDKVGEKQKAAEQAKKAAPAAQRAQQSAKTTTETAEKSSCSKCVVM